ncbi:MAG: radical SAM/SPASM domain-containing protein [Candidatus Omnitrophota bacterium]|nr:radical SAM/SPASM domain-containing protein [Candidatus Omnitrophota bacterium]
MANFITRFRNLIVDSYRGKKIMHYLLKSFIFTKNPVYRYLCLKDIRNKIPSLEKLPVFVTIENTNLCNLSCIFCANEQMARKRGFMDDNLFKSIIDQCVYHGIPNVLVQGFGEPLLDKDYVSKIRLAKEKGIKFVHCVTNGVLLNKALSEELINAGLDYIYISIDAATPEVYSQVHHLPSKQIPSDDFFTIVENIEQLINIKKKNRTKKPFIEVRFKDFELNKKDLICFMDKYRGRVDKVNIYMNITNWPGSTIRNNLPRVRMLKFPCFNLWSTLYVSYEGKVSLCCQDYECKVVIGDVKKESLIEIWNGHKLKNFRTLHLENKFDEISICGDCVVNTHLVTPWWQ